MDLCQEHLDLINKKLAEEHAGITDPAFAPMTYLVVTDLSLLDHAVHTQGKLVSFLERTRPTNRYSIGALYRSLFEEIKRRTNYERDGLDLPGLLEHKAISKSFFADLLNRLPESKNFDALWLSIAAQLSAEGVPYGSILVLKQNCTRYEIERMDPSNAILQRLIAIVERGSPSTSTRCRPVPA